MNWEGVTVDVDALVARHKRLQTLEKLLTEEHARGGVESPGARARQDIEDIIKLGLGAMKEKAGGVRGKLVDELTQLQKDAMSFYDGVLRSRGTPDLAGFKGILEDMRGHFDELRKPVTDAAKGADEAARAAAAAKPLENVQKTALKPDLPKTLMTPEAKLRSLEPKEQWAVSPDGKTATFTSKAGTGTTTARVLPDGKLEVEVHPTGKPAQTLKENQVMQRHGDQPTPHGNVLQSHHGVQSALLRDLLEGIFKYDADDWPTIWLRDHEPASPHGRISALQRGRSVGGTLDSIGAIRHQGVMDLLAADVPPETIRDYLSRFDKKFNDEVLPAIEKKITDPAARRKLIGDFKVY